MYDEAKIEKAQSTCLEPEILPWPDEEIFLCQLNRRATLLNHAFHVKVREVVQQHEIKNGDDTDRSSSAILGPYVRHEAGTTESVQRIQQVVTAHPSHDTRNSLRECKTDGRLEATDSGVFIAVKGTKIHQYESASQARLLSRNKISPEQEHIAGTAMQVQTEFCRTESNQSLFGACERVECRFQTHPAYIEMYFAPIKTIARMREKVAEYARANEKWPHSANILDPVRASIVCDSPSEILEAFEWFRSGNPGLQLCRLKNKFAYQREDLVGGYRDLMASYVFEGACGLRIIGEVQFQDRALHELKLKVFLTSLDESLPVIASNRTWVPCKLIVLR